MKTRLLIIILPLYGTLASIVGQLHTSGAHESYVSFFLNPLVSIFTIPYIRYFPVENYTIVMGPELISFFILVNSIFWIPIAYIISKIWNRNEK